jgi:hypothetical protein
MIAVAIAQATINATGLVEAGLARRCRCERPWVVNTDDAPRSLKCGRAPAVRLPAGSDAAASATSERKAEHG